MRTKEQTISNYTKKVEIHFLRLFNYLKHNKIDIINIHGISILNTLIVLLKPFHRIPIVYTAHGLIKDEIKMGAKIPFYTKYMELLTLKKSDAITTVSKTFKKCIIQSYQFLKERPIHVIYNAIDDNTCKIKTPDISLLPVEYSTTNKFKLLFIGRLSYIKGIDVLFKSIQDLNVVLLIIGDSSNYFLELQEKHKDLFISHKIIHLENVDKYTIHSAYQFSNVFILPSRQDSFPLVVLEAMIHGKPVIITEQVGAKEIIENGNEGYVIKINDPDQLRDILKDLMKDPQKLQTMGNNAKKKALEMNISNYANNYLKLLQRIAFDNN